MAPSCRLVDALGLVEQEQPVQRRRPADLLTGTICEPRKRREMRSIKLREVQARCWRDGG